MLTSSFACTPSPATRRDHLVGVHVRRGAGAGLEDVDRELVVQLAGGDAVGGLGDPGCLVGVEQAELAVHARGGGLDRGRASARPRPGSARRRPGSSRSPWSSHRPRARASPPCPSRRRTLAGDANAPVGQQPVAEPPAQRLVELLDVGPADVGAARALMLRLVPTLSAVEAFHHHGRACPCLGTSASPDQVIGNRCLRPVCRSFSHVCSFTRGRPSGSPALRSAASIACQPAARRAPRRGAPRAPRAFVWSPHLLRFRRPARASSSSASTVSVASFLFVPMTPLGPRLIQPAA